VALVKRQVSLIGRLDVRRRLGLISSGQDLVEQRAAQALALP